MKVRNDTKIKFSKSLQCFPIRSRVAMSKRVLVSYGWSDIYVHCLLPEQDPRMLPLEDFSDSGRVGSAAVTAEYFSNSPPSQAT